MFASLAELKVQLEPIKKFKKNDFHLKYNFIGKHPWCLVRFWMLPSPPTLIFSVHMFTLLLNVLEKTVIKKLIETVTLTSLTKMKSVDVFDEKLIRSIHFRL